MIATAFLAIVHQPKQTNAMIHIKIPHPTDGGLIFETGDYSFTLPRTRPLAKCFCRKG